MIPALLRFRSLTAIFAWQRQLTLLTWFAALAFSAWVVADLFWRLAAPSPSISLFSAQRDPAVAAGHIAEQHLFGAASSTPGPDDIGRIVLYGTVTGDDRHPGFAIISIDGGPAKETVAGQELLPGLALSHIGPDRIELSGTSGTRTVPLKTMRTGTDAMNGSARVAPAAAGPLAATDTSRSIE